MKQPRNPSSALASSPAASSSDSGSENARAATCPIPDHELLKRIGRGSYGEVWLARNVLGEYRAVKIVWRREFGDDDRPFQREFEGIQRFEPISRSHPSQLAILHVGKNDAAGCFYYVMELADAMASAEEKMRNGAEEIIPSAPQPPFSPADYVPHTLRSELKARGALPAAEVVELGFALTTALAHLHAQGLVHRDIKPSNIIFVGGRPKLADIGLVTDAAAGDDTRSIVGTEGYLAPEGPGRAQADIFALGKVLYEAATGLDRRQFPQLPPDLRSRSDADALIEINEVFLKACDIHRYRYESADQMRHDLELLQAHQSVKRRRAWQRTWTDARKFVAVCIALAVVSAIIYWLGIAWPKHPDFVWSKNRDANDQYKMGLSLLHNDGTWRQAVDHFESAIKMDSEFAEAYAQLAAAWIAAGDGAPKDVAERAKSAAQKAVTLNPDSSFGHAILASVKILFDLDWTGAEEERSLAVRLNSRGGIANPEEILLESAINLAVMGKPNDALAILEKASASPESMSHWRLWLTARTYEGCRQFDQAINIYERYLQAVPGERASTLELQASAFIGKGDYTRAIRLEKLAALERNPARVDSRFGVLERAFKERGSSGFWEARLESEKLRSEPEHFMRMAAIFARLDHVPEALDFLGRARSKTPHIFASYINMDPSFDSLRSDRRFRNMVDELWRKK